MEVALALLRAGVDVDDEDIEDLLLRGQDILNVADDTGATLLHYTSWRYSPSVNRLLLRLGADPHIRDNDGRTPLFNAIFRGENEDRVSKNAEVLLEGGANIDTADIRGLAPLLYAISMSSVSDTRLKLMLGDAYTPSPRGASGPVPLHTLIKMMRRAENRMDVVLALALSLGIANELTHRVNPSDLSDLGKEARKLLMQELREV
ncbi:hypothetical protein BOTBODRAFT_355223 [Botryobasidium botryosum FD-172 SS1]|uniref:Uncharacterized protein n=1 Tax=Botryobasidium botryosum (strain FD-172 SS1) TaxID=930990 RepID=A0A067MEH2_BOTB1|nr:hypothetical protein BOTBODRAFT_355223 [Botryobasidium botryosum FD-172 SS1]